MRNSIMEIKFIAGHRWCLIGRKDQAIRMQIRDFITLDYHDKDRHKKDFVICVCEVPPTPTCYRTSPDEVSFVLSQLPG